jgi:hypothetical protein
MEQEMMYFVTIDNAVFVGFVQDIALIFFSLLPQNIEKAFDDQVSIIIDNFV